MVLHMNWVHLHSGDNLVEQQLVWEVKWMMDTKVIQVCSGLSMQQEVAEEMLDMEMVLRRMKLEECMTSTV
jgi:hypothetical protein